ncbi:MAG TPA: hypothetical protein VM867_09635 [Xanthobacteraceae bacterium]|nr:hypothetical protein [Xanthobacteraceae bacterium]
MPRELFLPGSLPCDTAEQSFQIFGGALGQWLDYMPDGEVGTRRYWIDGIAYRVFNGHPEIETVKYPAPENGVEQWWPRGRHDEFGFRVKPGVSKVRFGDPGWRLGFARDAINSYALFRYMKKDGVIPKHVRFQVCIPLSYSSVRYFFPDEDVEKVIPGFTEALRTEVAKIVEMIPNDDLAIQWDLAIENRMVDVAINENGAEAAKKEAERVCAPAYDVCSWLPKDVHLGHHMCFGTLSGWPSRQPPSLLGAVTLSNAAVVASGRKVEFLHIPTLGSAEDAFFAPLADLKHDGSAVYMGSIHHLHGKGGLGAQLKAIKKYLPEFGIGAPCGFGRAADRPGRLLADDGGKTEDPIKTVIEDHKAAAATLREVLRG